MYRIVRLVVGALAAVVATAALGACTGSSSLDSVTVTETGSTPAPVTAPDPDPVEQGREDDAVGQSPDADVDTDADVALATPIPDVVATPGVELTSDASETEQGAARGGRAQPVEPTPTRNAMRAPPVTPTATPTATAVPTPTATATPTPTPTATPTPTPTPAPTTLFVAVDGTGDGFRPDEPMGSIADAMQLVRPGMTLEIAAGRYVGDLRVEDPPAGTATEPIRVRTTGRVEIEGLVRFWGLEHWDIAGLNVTWPDWGTSNDHLVKLTGGSNWVFRDAEVWGAESYAGILVAGPAEFYTLTGLYVRDTVASNEVNQDHLIYLNPRSGPGLVTRNLLVGSPNGRAVKVGGAVSEEVVADIEISFNTMVDNRGPSNVQVSGQTYDITIRNNIMVQSGEGRRAITTYDFQGDNVVAQDNVVWETAGLADGQIHDLGGNLRLDPEFDDAYRATNPQVLHAGHRAD